MSQHGADRVGHLEQQLHAIGEIGAALATAVGLDALFERIVPEISNLMDAERTTLFLYDEARAEIWSKVAQGENVREIRLALGQGLAGWVAQHREAVLIDDAYQDARFNPDVDKRTGFHTRSLAIAPVIDRHGRLIGVLQVLNHHQGPFTEADLALLGAIATQTSYAIVNAALEQDLLDRNLALDAARAHAEQRRAELDLLYQVERQVSATFDLDELIDSVLQSACERLRSDAGSVLLVNDEGDALIFRCVKGPRKEALQDTSLRRDQGLVGWVFERRQAVILNRPQDDPRHDRQIAAAINYPAQALLAVPLICDDRAIGVIEVMNPAPRSDASTGYDEADLRVLSVIAGQLAGAITHVRERQSRVEMEHLAVMGRMLAGVAHDLRNPMTVISGYAQIMAAEPAQAERQASSARIVAQVEEMTNMVSDLLAFARGETKLHPSIINVQALAAELSVAIEGRCDHRGVLLELHAGADTAVVDVNRTRRIVYNLANNAIEALGQGGHLWIQLSADDAGLHIRVRDDGPGLPSAVQQRMFKPFVTEGKVHGTGLGLAIVKRFVDDHRGEIQVTTAPDQGTTFDVFLRKASA